MKTYHDRSFIQHISHWCLLVLFAFVLAACGGGGSQSNTTDSVTISLANLKQPAGASTSMPITLNMKAVVTAMQFDIDYDPTGISLDPQGVATTLSNGQKVYASPVAENRLRIVIAPTEDLQQITDGDIVSLSLLLSNTATGDYTLKVNNTVIVGAGSKGMKNYSIQNGTVSIE